LICTPYDAEARYSQKRGMFWTGYKVHVTESCDDDGPHLVTDVQTTPAPVSDFDMIPSIQAALGQRDLLPNEQVVDAGYVTAAHIISSQTDSGIDLVGPIAPDNSWQAQAAQGFGTADFEIDWQAHTARCPQGHQSVLWMPRQDRNEHEVIHIKFAAKECLACPVRSQCTHAVKEPRSIMIRAQPTYEVLQRARQRQQTPAFKELYATRAGIEGTLSQGVRAFELRRSRYVGEAKTRFQMCMTAVAINVVRIGAWIEEQPRGLTRCSRFAALAPTG
jgi:transposase